MKLILIVFSSIIISTLILSCDKDVSYDLNSTISASLASQGGECFSSIIYGSYKENTATNPDSNYVLLSINVQTPGAWKIKTDTVNGIYFSGEGSEAKEGKATIKLIANGKPIVANFGSIGTPFTVRIGESTCTFYVIILPDIQKSIFSILGAPNTCSGAIVQGIYKLNTPLNPNNNIIKTTVFVSIDGFYTFGPVEINGMVFQSSNIFTGTNNQEMIINASGTPNSAGTFNLNVAFGPSICSVPITVSN